MTTTPAMPELPEPDRTMWQHGKQIDLYTADQMRAYALAILQAQPAEVSDERLLEIGREWTKEVGWYEFEVNDFIGCARAILALRPQAAQPAPEWIGGEPANLQAAARDADEWLALIQRLNDAGRWRFSQPDSRAKLDGCRAALSKILCAARPQAVPMTEEQATYKQAEGSKNCMQCAAAYMLGLPLAEVPDFEQAGPQAWESFYEFFEGHGFTAEMFPPSVEIEGDYLASGDTERGTSHMVVMRGGKLLHDPHPSNAGLKSVQVVWLITRRSVCITAPAGGEGDHG